MRIDYRRQGAARYTEGTLKISVRVAFAGPQAPKHNVRDDFMGSFNEISRERLSSILEDLSSTSRTHALLFSTHYLERIGHWMVNIAERVIFMASGK